MKLFLLLLLVLPSVSSAANMKFKNYTCEITFKEPVIGFTNNRDSSSDTERITNRALHDIAAISTEFAFQKVVDREVKAGIDGSFLVDTGLYTEDARAIKKNKLAQLSLDNESLNKTVLEKLDARKKLYKEFKTITCN